MEEAVQQTKNPLGTQPIGKLIARFSIPAIISMLVNAVYNMVDQIFIGQGIGMLGNAATNVAFPLVTICIAVSLLIGIGSASNFNLRLGEGDKGAAARYAGNGLLISVLFGTVIGIVAFAFLDPMLLAFGATEAVMPYAHAYTGITCLGIPFLVFATVASNLVRADGSPGYAMVIVVAGAGFNIIFDPVFMFGFGWGIEGIAWATTLGQMLSAGLAVIYLFRFKSVSLGKNTLRLQKKRIGKIFSLGSASFINQMAMTVVQIALNNVLVYYGAMSVYGSEIPLAVVGVISKVNILYMSFAIGVAQGCQPINGFNYGAKNYERVKGTYKRAMLIVMIISIIAFVLFQLFPRPLTSIFGSGSEEYYHFAEQYFRIFMFCTFLNGIQPVSGNFFSSIGKAGKGIFISLTRQIIFLLPLVLILPALLGIEGVLYAGPIADAAAAAVAIIFGWREMKELTRMEQALAT